MASRTFLNTGSTLKPATVMKYGGCSVKVPLRRELSSVVVPSAVASAISAP
jgi:hypothetical protein